MDSGKKLAVSHIPSISSYEFVSRKTWLVREPHSLTMTRAFSAPGKALLVGGYLVLFPEYSGYSVALSSRMHAVVESYDSEELIISSPQFDSRWIYSLSKYTCVSGTHKNPFLDAVVSSIGTYFGGALKPGRIEIYSDAGFHSQKYAHNGQLPQFSYHSRQITEVPKTGLGSSAALCTVVTRALVSLQDPLESDLQKIHNLSQIAHCHAQGKVGSGFDVATAVFGSINYSRFDPKCIPAQNDVDSLRASVNTHWHMLADTVSPPESIAFVFGDISGGSETPGMVKKVLSWKDANPETSLKLFNLLQQANSSFMHLLKTQAHPDEIKRALDKVRALLRSLTQDTGVPIEPLEQTKLLDAACNVEGVINGVVPGAGGNDAVCLIVEAPHLQKVLNMLESIPNVSWSVEHPSKGLQEEDPGLYRV